MTTAAEANALTYTVTLAAAGFRGRKASYRVAVAATEADCALDARTVAGKAAGVRVQYVKGTQNEATLVALRMMQGKK